jgi:CDP-glucose 4,6-dehydratase
MDNLKVVELVREALSILRKGTYEIDSSNNFHEAGLLKLDISKAVSILDWNPLLNSKTAIQNTMKWYQVYNSNKSQICDFTISQIEDFQQIINK